MSELTCRPGMKLITGSTPVDPNNKIAPFCIDETEVIQGVFWADVASSFHVVEKDCKSGAWIVKDIKKTRLEALSALKVAKVDGKHGCDAKVRGPFSESKLVRRKIDGGNRGDFKPMIYVNWRDAKAYCESRGGSLPTSNQWEKAARGPKGLVYGTKSGDLKLEEANYMCLGSAQAPVDVASYEANAYGLYDMTGNVWEWVLDGGKDWGIRGGSWYADRMQELRADYRGRQAEKGSFEIGFRCVMSPS
ncbi:MAG: SUMF1/EgtB/PvdO family nonheme iron enzyme [Deltaproteobacteria bacterium]|nr:SUMF1/EgtB/PvdO family nonheme iron enzyme [Deltaproteobacteria bacterium]